MKRIVHTSSTTILADTVTPVSAYIKTRDIFPKAILLESTDFHHLENCFSFICLSPIAGIEIKNRVISTEIMGELISREKIDEKAVVEEAISNFIKSFDVDGNHYSFNSFFGYIAYDAVKYFEKIDLSENEQSEGIPDIRFDMFRFILAFNHLKNEIQIIENRLTEGESELEMLKSILFNNKIGQYSFRIVNNESSNMTDDEYMSNVKKAKSHCKRGDVFQLVMSRAFSQDFKGDEFNVYRRLRSLNPSPYLFYFDYGNFKIFGSSPESQIVVKGEKVYINPIAGTFGRTGDDDKDKELSIALSEDPKENAEHVMLVDLARNDLSRNADEVVVESFREIHFYSHVIHIVSTVSGKLNPGVSALKVVGDSFPAGTLSGAPKHRAMQLIEKYEPTKRGFYGGCIGMLGLNGDVNLAILIRSFLSRNNKLHYQAGAGIVMKSDEKKELEEVNMKLQALKKAIELANKI